MLETLYAIKVIPELYYVTDVLRPVHTRRLVVHNLLCATCLIVWTGKSSKNQPCTTSRKVVHDLEKSRPMFNFGTTNSIPGVKVVRNVEIFNRRLFCHIYLCFSSILHSFVSKYHQNYLDMLYSLFLDKFML